MRREAEKIALDLEIDSAGTADWHVGRPPDSRAVAAARRAGIDISRMRARQVTRADFHRFDHIVALDLSNLAALEAIRPVGARARLALLLDHVSARAGQGVADPYYGEVAQFDATWNEVATAARGLARKIADGAL